eukprot:885630-Rhodomonas_salina.1
MAIRWASVLAWPYAGVSTERPSRIPHPVQQDTVGPYLEHCEVKVTQAHPPAVEDHGLSPA